jgi:hypothetical protein
MAIEGAAAKGEAGTLASQTRPAPSDPPPQPPREVPLEARATIQVKGVGNATVDDGGLEVVPFSPTRVVLTLQQRLARDPQSIRDAAQDLLVAVSDEAERLRLHNEPAVQDCVDFLRWLAGKLNELIGALDRLIAAPGEEPMFLGFTGEIVEQLKLGTLEYLQEHRAELAGYSFKFGLSLAAVKLAAVFGVDAETVLKWFKH